ncbi:MAG: response regulator [Anaerolineales bacterium]|nr:response regulator [Anaerolineales bacterium]MCX7754924.1 response regulator [Anaerolineales bacterium]MDW8278145.1 response regulator [Anaerolineales bacterium]
MRTGPILVVEDVPNVLELLEVTLRFKGYEVASARNGIEALEMVEKVNPALIISDILMPKMDGYAFVQKLRINPATRRIPVIFLSATYVTPEDKKFALSLGATRFIEKPIDTEDFLLTVAEIMTQEPETGPEPLNPRDFYLGYRDRLENKLRYKSGQITRIERLVPTLPPEQRPAFESMLQQAKTDRENIQAELDEIYRIIEELKITGK